MNTQAEPQPRTSSCQLRIVPKLSDQPLGSSPAAIPTADLNSLPRLHTSKLQIGSKMEITSSIMTRSSILAAQAVKSLPY